MKKTKIITSLQERRHKYDTGRGILKDLLKYAGIGVTGESVSSIKTENFELSCGSNPWSNSKKGFREPTPELLSKNKIQFKKTKARAMIKSKRAF